MNRNKVHERLSKLEGSTSNIDRNIELWKKAKKYKLYSNSETGEIIGWEEYKIVNAWSARNIKKSNRSRGVTEEEYDLERTRIEPELFKILESES